MSVAEERERERGRESEQERERERDRERERRRQREAERERNTHTELSPSTRSTFSKRLPRLKSSLYPIEDAPLLKTLQSYEN